MNSKTSLLIICVLFTIYCVMASAADETGAQPQKAKTKSKSAVGDDDDSSSSSSSSSSSEENDDADAANKGKKYNMHR